mgnify:CR=1 FL=1
MFETPILFLIFNRPGQTRKVFERIKQIKPQKLFINADGPRENNNEDIRNCGNVRRIVEQIQRDLFIIGSILAGSKLVFSLSRTKDLENEIDKIEKKLPKLSNFILPGGDKSASYFHLARSVTRRTERNIEKLKRVNSNIKKYINRLSDLAFILARYQNFKKRKKETVWK